MRYGICDRIEVKVKLHSKFEPVIFQGAMEGLMQLVKVNIRPRNLPEFFWHHLERDVELLVRSIGRSMDESAIAIHLVLKEILQRNPPTGEQLMADDIQ